MANPEHVRQLLRGSENWNAWRDKTKEMHPDLYKANLSNVDLSRADLNNANLSRAILIEANLSNANLSNANLSRAILNEAKLSKADLSRAILSDADLSRANLRNANLSNVDLSRADLSGANLSGADLLLANLNKADLSRADLSGTTLAIIDMRTTTGLQTIRHIGPSHIELFSVQLPPDGSALHFLRGAGVPDEWIDVWRQMMMHPIQYHSCFLSYSSKDERLAERLHADLQAQGVRCWFAPKDLKIGNVIRQRIDEAIHLQDKLLLLLSKHAIRSTWVQAEVEAAFEKEQRQGRDVLFPVRLDDAVLQTTEAWAATLRRTRHIGDFTRWETASAYEHAFARLVRDLQHN